LAGYSASQHSLRVLADALRDEVNMQGIRVTSIYLGRTATKRIAKLFNAERKVFNPALLLQPDDVAESVLYALSLPATAEVVDLTIRPAIKSY
jgi:NADP-dependent 3-hydroxy acid dehydrogenase YdfG